MNFSNSMGGHGTVQEAASHKAIQWLDKLVYKVSEGFTETALGFKLEL